MRFDFEVDEELEIQLSQQCIDFLNRLKRCFDRYWDECGQKPHKILLNSATYDLINTFVFKNCEYSKNEYMHWRFYKIPKQSQFDNIEVLCTDSVAADFIGFVEDESNYE